MYNGGVLNALSKLSREELAGKRVLVRCDLDVARDDQGNLTEDFRLQKMVPTLKLLLESDVKQVIICGHLNRPGGQVKEEDRLDKVAKRLSELLGRPINKLNNTLPEKLPGDKLVMLENLRFCSGEEANDELFAKTLASYAEIFINECFSNCHRNHASIAGITKFILPYAGLQLTGEVKMLSSVLSNPKRPLVVIIGGAKLETKVPVIQSFLSIADYILVGGKVGFEALESKKITVSTDQKLVYPLDGAPDNKDIGPQTISKFVKVIKTAQTVVWNGPLGMFEEEQFMVGTKAVAEAIVYLRVNSIIGGGDTIAALQKLDLLDKMTFASTGGGAMLNLLAGNSLPGIAALEA